MPITAVGGWNPLRFNSSLRPAWETKPAAISSRMVVDRAAARESAACLSANAPCRPRLRDDASPLARFIGPSWPDLDLLS